MKNINGKLYLFAVLLIGIISLTACTPDKKTTDDCCLSYTKVNLIINNTHS